MRLYWYAGTSAALAGGVVTYAFNQRANFYSAMVYLSQNNLSLMILINLILLVYGSFVYGLQRLCYGQLRPVEIEQLYEKAWIAVTETCLAMTIFREEVGAWFLVMFTALVTGKVWEWIGEGRVEVLEQQPPANPRLFHTRLSISLLLSLAYDTWLFTYAINTVIQQARPNMMVMYLFEFAILTACSFRTSLRYVITLIEADIVRKQTVQRLADRRRQVRNQRADILRRRESGDAAEAAAANQEVLPEEDDVDEMDIEVPGWESKGQWVLSLDLITDFIKLSVYMAFFAIIMMFYGLPIHIMRDLFMTARSFLKRLGALMRYRKAVQDMNKYPDATEEELARENTCIICREDMRPWDPSATGSVERSRPKKLPCGHILHFGCLKSWLERQQVCPTCRRSVVLDGAPVNVDIAVPRVDQPPPAAGQAPRNNGGGNAGQPEQDRQGGMRMFQLGPLRLGFAQGNAENVQELAQRMAAPLDAANPPAPAATPLTQLPNPPVGEADSFASIPAQLQEIQQRIYTAMQSQQMNLAHTQALQALWAETNRLAQVQQLPQTAHQHAVQSPVAQPFAIPTAQQPIAPFPGLPQMGSMAFPRVNTPALTRHGGASYSTAIPAGSPELPDGVVLPPGWSLLPLQRLDGHPPPSQPQTVQPNIAHTGSVDQGHGGQLGGHDVDAGIHVAESSLQGPLAEPTNNPTNADQPGPSSNASDGIARETRVHAPQMAAPTPVMPNWGGPAQLFAHGESGPSSTSMPQQEGSSKQGSAVTHPEGEQPDSQATPNGDDKGKAKAVTLEDAEDE